MARTKQIIVIGAVVALVAVLLAQPIKGLVNNDKETAAASESQPSNEVNLENISSMTKQGLDASLVKEISDIEAQVANASGEGKVKLLQQLADKWDDVAKPAPQAFVYEEMAKVSPKFEYWLKAGNAYRAAYTNLQDSTLAQALNQNAIHAYEAALKANSSSLDAKTGLGAAMVSGTNNPMAGIALLREVVTADPKNLEANKTLGLFSLQSRQFDKAIERFKTVIDQKPDAESYFYLATGYENIGMKKEAVVAFQKSKELAADPSLSQFIDRKIEELSK
ncbi:tetratricopeptide repeat protein [Sphingobacterium sp. N143]|uniref:tetratricopeptide repeat protein n=1 Tax=Sphingobacterium sp. N143 TaxID=2746727 RepID=UPI0025788003|nr:tetratricopeptide repeat protein [Sphingobacterium sp. N143]MDM1296126.1 tetratricopeptide repeat protein [Sphingobacterium sp. N143]